MIATVRSKRDETVVQRTGAHDVVRTDGCSTDETVDHILRLAPDGLRHVIEVAFDANVNVDEKVLMVGGSIAAYATNDPSPEIPFWPLVFKNVSVFFLGSDDFPSEAKEAAARAINEALEAEWPGFEIGRRFPLEAIADAHKAVEEGQETGRVIVKV